MLKMIEVYLDGDNNFENYKMREISVNPLKIIKVTPADQVAIDIHINGALPGLSKDCKFVRVHMDGGLSFTVAESVETLNEKINQSPKSRLLKG